MMQCARCKTLIAEGEAKMHFGRILCEDCYLDVVSPVKACDPWAVYSASMFIKKHRHEPQLTLIQQKIIDSLRREGALEPDQISARLQIKESDLERELAPLRHMEKIRGELRGGKRVVRLWDQ